MPTSTTTPRPTDPATGAVLLDAPGSTSTTDLVHAPQEDVGTIYRVLDREDELQIAADIAGHAIDVMAYKFMVGNKQVFGLSWKGVTEACVRMATMGMGRPTVSPEHRPFFDTVEENGEEAWECMAYAVDLNNGTGRWGMATNLKVMHLTNGTIKPDNMSRRKALSKAQRNALLALVPQAIQTELLTAALAAGQVKDVRTPRQQAQANAGARGQRQLEGTAAEAPAPYRVASAKQQGMLNARLAKAGIDDERMHRVLFAWVGGQHEHLDRFPGGRVDALLSAIEDIDATVAEITDRAKSGDQSAKYLVDTYLEPMREESGARR